MIIKSNDKAQLPIRLNQYLLSKSTLNTSTVFPQKEDNQL